jgi:hypothetical protein
MVQQGRNIMKTYTKYRVNWGLVLDNIGQKMNRKSVCRNLGITVDEYRSIRETEPPFSVGLGLLDLHEKLCGFRHNLDRVGIKLGDVQNRGDD